MSVRSIIASLRDASRPALVSAGLAALAAWPGGARELTVRLSANGLPAAPIRIELEEYVAGVLAGEAGGLRSAGALRAMAVAARTFAVRFAGRHRDDGFDFCETTHCQDFRPGGAGDRVRAAVEATEGELVWWAGSPAATYYTRNCGGRSESAARVWPDQKAPYLGERDDRWCGREPWTATVKKDELGRAAAAAGWRAGAVPAVTVVRRTPAGRAADVRVGARVMPAAAFRFAVGRTLGWNLLRSEWWEARDEGDRVRFAGQGAGHGVGLCQAGAEAMGAAGRGYREILAAYYPGTAVGLTAQGLAWRAAGGERVEVLATGDGRPVLALAEAAAGEVERRSGLRLTRKPRVRLYPSVAAFRDATGEAGWAAASTRGGVIRLAPSGATAATLRHEMAHVLVEQRARPGLPLWFREGLALWLDGRRRAAEPARAPRDEDFARARTAAELARVYEAALGTIGGLVKRHGEREVIGWLERGIPPDVSVR